MSGPLPPDSVLHALLACDREFSTTVVTSPDFAAAPAKSRRDLLAMAGGAARFLAASGVGHGDRVVFFLDTSFALFAGVLGAWSLGAITTIQPVHWPKAHKAVFDRRMRSIIEQTAPTLIVAADDLIPSIATLLAECPDPTWTVMPQSALAAACVDGGPVLEAAACEPSDIAHLQFTSGSTGDPKGVPVSHGQIIAHGLRCAVRSQFESDAVMVHWLPMHHDFGFFIGLLMPLAIGGTSVHLTPRLFVQSPSLWLRALSHFRGTNTAAPPSALDLLGRSLSPDLLADIDLSAVRVVTVAAEPLFIRRLQKLETALALAKLPLGAISPAYGLAESIAAVAAHPVPATLASRTCGTADVVDCGKLLPGVDVVILDDDGGQSPGGTVGQIAIRGDTVITRYWGDDGPSPEWLLTGDLGFLQGGHLFITGRIKDLIIRAGANVHPQWIENAVESIPADVLGCAVFRACAFAVRDEMAGRERVAVAIEARRAPASAEPVVRKAVLDATGIALDDVIFVAPGAIPRTTSGKLQRGLCRELLIATEQSA